MRCFCRMRSASSSVVPTATVTRFSFVITEPTSCAWFFSNRRSRLVRIPVSREPRVTGRPEILYLFMISSACRSVMSGEIVTGSTIMPLSERFTRSTSSPCRSMGMLRCIIPMPPCRAMAMARRDSVTVSMAAEASGMFIGSLRAKFVVVSTSVGSTDDLPGRSSTSSKVRPSEIILSIIPASRKKIGRAQTGAIKQRSPAGPRWAGRQLHQIEKMHHRESSILRGIAIPVKLRGKGSGQQRRCLWNSLAAWPYNAALPERKTGADSTESAPASVISFDQSARLEREAHTEFAPNRAWDNDAVRVDEPDRMAERGRAGNVAAKVVAVVAAIRQVERLRHQLQIHAFTEFDVLR